MDAKLETKFTYVAAAELRFTYSVLKGPMGVGGW